ncbi:unnamed protein product [Tuber melanosporum]|uniref:(Perigord truffle) hypothetical protein n=1 Tax=Tuber melanosporum (strain Mel28) TaxID=656061 RepID=D5GJW9_TUBMM|nr:uncharacterized protein GSTUM_00009248001 [Tuber melanosporum]CAZ84812.1 unnamed protein product [Tuber melanosporum]
MAKLPERPSTKQFISYMRLSIEILLNAENQNHGLIPPLSPTPSYLLSAPITQFRLPTTGKRLTVS